MQPISKYTFTAGLTTKDVSFVVDQDIDIRNLSFEGCEFEFRQPASLNFERCDIKRCRFISNNSDNVYQQKCHLNFNGCNGFSDNKINGLFRDVRFTNTPVSRLEDKSTVLNYSLDDLQVVDSQITGSCEALQLRKLYLNSFSDGTTCYWDKEIIQSCTCINVVFANVKVNPFYFATKCHDKSSLDLSRATLIDNWSKLRKKYSGLSLFIIFLLTFIFFLPLLTHSFFLLTLSKVEATFHIHKQIPLWEALLFGGKEGFAAIVYCILTITLLLYNIGRLFVTITVARFREEEAFLKDSNFTSVSVHPDKYKLQLSLDRILSVMLWISLSYALLKLFDTLRIMVPSIH